MQMHLQVGECVPQQGKRTGRIPRIRTSSCSYVLLHSSILQRFDFPESTAGGQVKRGLFHSGGMTSCILFLTASVFGDESHGQTETDGQAWPGSS